MYGGRNPAVSMWTTRPALMERVGELAHHVRGI